MRERQLRMNFDIEYRIENDDPVRLLEKIIDKLYETEIETSSEYNGIIPEDVMMKILVYAYMNTAYSSRAIEKYCKRDINFMYLLNFWNAPDHSTISRFRKRMAAQIERVFYGVVRCLKEFDEISGQNLFIDGTKIEANAGRYTFVWKKAVQKNETKLLEKIESAKDALKQETGLIFSEDASPSEISDTLKRYCHAQGIEFVSGRGHHKHLLQKWYELFSEYAKRMEKYESYNLLFDGRSSFSKTDTDATFMRMKEDHMQNGQLKPGYNMQIAVEGEYILGVDISSERSDMRTLIPFLEKMKKRNIFEMQRIIADAGYESEENYSYLSTEKLESYIKPSNYEMRKKRKYKQKFGLAENMEYHEDGDYFACKGGQTLKRIGTAHSTSPGGYVSEKAIYKCDSCDGCPYRENCTKAKNGKQIRISHAFMEYRKQSQENVSTELGKQLRINRSIQAEGAFGVLKQNYSFRRFLTRGITNVKNEFLLLCTAFNIKKLAAKISGKRTGISLFLLRSG